MLKLVFFIFIIFFNAVQLGVSESNTKFITIKKIQEKWWFVNQENIPFFSIGMNVVSSEDSTAKLGAKHYNALRKYSKITDWAKDTYNLLTNSGFNTIGCWSDPETIKFKMPYTLVIEDMKSEVNRLMNIFDPQFEKVMERVIKAQCAPHSEDPNLIGYFLGNDLFWFGDYAYFTGHSSYLFDMYFDLPGSSPGKKKVIEFLSERYKTIENFNSVWNLKLKNFEEIGSLKRNQFNSKDIDAIRNEFLTLLAERYYSVIVGKIKTFDKNHLIFSDRFANSVPEPVLKVCMKYCDIISINYYKNLPDIDRDFLTALYKITDKPLIISEFTFRSMDNTSGLMNDVGPDTTVSNQQDRADHYKKYTKSFAELPFILGYHWFQFFDEPQDGRMADDEDSNYGLMDQDGRIYLPLLKAMKESNPIAEGIHRNSVSTISKNEIHLTYSITVRDGKKNPAFGSNYLNLDSLQNNFVTSWGDTDKGAWTKVQGKKKMLVVDYHSGRGWGCGISIYPPNYQKIGYFDATGYKGIKIKMRMPEKLKFFFNLNESGVDKPWVKNYPGANGADGEAFSADEAFGIGKSTVYYYDFDKMFIRPIWGNQVGNKIVDLQAINDIELSIPGNQGTGSFIIEEISLY